MDVFYFNQFFKNIFLKFLKDLKKLKLIICMFIQKNSLKKLVI